MSIFNVWAEHHSEDFIQMNPLMKVPVMKDGDFILGESVAILLYLCRKFRAPDHWYPADAQKCGLVDEYLAWQQANIKKHCAKVLWLKMVIPHFFKCPVPQKCLDEAITKLTQSLDMLEMKFLRNKLFLAGDQISLADLMALEDLIQVISVGFNVFKNWPWIKIWMGRVEATLGHELLEETRKSIMNLKNTPSLSSDTMRKFDIMKSMLF
ncbi:glutathione S-transferase theta-1-like isoform X2 [Macrotis lagotis]|uniref:glutathione S-transferase theta-1-like isoform X2 n=1 Tax=Macrotis lagotis TaxID=92651 RepID=UPI003D68BC93